MNGRRGFLALVSGATVTGSVLFRKATAAPMLILPSADLIASPAERPRALFYPLLATHESDVHALAHIRQMMPEEAFHDWLEGGLRSACFYNRRDEATLERIVDAAVAKHGSIIAAKRAGDL